MQIGGTHTWAPGPFSAVIPHSGEESVAPPLDRTSQEPESLPNLPPDLIDRAPSLDELSALNAPRTSPFSTQSLRRSGLETAVRTLEAFPQVIQILSEPFAELGAEVARQAGLPLLSLDEEMSVDTLASVLQRTEYQQGFVLQGAPATPEQAEALDRLLAATPEGERRVLSWDSNESIPTEVVDHYVDKGLLWMLPAETENLEPVRSLDTVLQCLVGLPAFENLFP